MKRLFGFVCLLASSSAHAQTFQFVIKVQDETGKGLKGVSMGDLHVRTADDGMAVLALPEGKTTLRLHLNGFVDQVVDVITSRIVQDNQVTFTLKKIPLSARKIFVNGVITTSPHPNFKTPVANVQVKLFYSGRQQTTESNEDGSFSFEIPDTNLDNYEWVIHYYHPDYHYVSPFSFAVPKTNYIDLTPSLAQKSSYDSTEGHYANFILNPLPWKADYWDVMDLAKCRCLTKEEKGFQIKVNRELVSVHLKIVRKGYSDVDFFMTREDLMEKTSAEYINMSKEKYLKMSRMNAKLSWNYSISSGGLLVSPNNQSLLVMWHPPNLSLKNKLAYVAGLSTHQTVETVNRYQTLSGFEGTVTSRYFLVNQGTAGLRYYWDTFTLRELVLYGQVQVNFIRQKPLSAFNQENFTSERRSYFYLEPSLQVGLRKNLFPFMAIEGSLTTAWINLKSQSFTFNYFGSAYPTEDRNHLIRIGVSAGLVFYIPLQ